jgi:hypothetical protein
MWHRVFDGIMLKSNESMMASQSATIIGADRPGCRRKPKVQLKKRS